MHTSCPNIKKSPRWPYEWGKDLRTAVEVYMEEGHYKNVPIPCRLQQLVQGRSFCNVLGRKACWVELTMC